MENSFREKHKGFNFEFCKTDSIPVESKPDVARDNDKEALLKEVLDEMKNVLKDQKTIEIGLEKDVIYLTTYFPINSSKIPLKAQPFLFELEDIINKKLNPVKGQGHSCVLGDDVIKKFNFDLSNDRISKLMSIFNLQPPSLRKEGLGASVPQDLVNHEKNRRATIRFSLKEEILKLKNQSQSENEDIGFVRS